MQTAAVEIHTGGLDGRYKEIGAIEAKVSVGSAFSSAPTIADVDAELRVKAAAVYANAVINVEYSRGMSLTSYRVLKARGVAVLKEADDKICHACAETVKRAAKVCRYCAAAQLD